MKLNLNLIPTSLRDLPQWVLWRVGQRSEGDKPTKLPYQVNGQLAKANDPSTWSTFDAVSEAYRQGGYDGVGFEFSESNPFCGIDLDGCRNPETGTVAEWAKEIVIRFASYAEVSPSETGVKIFCRARSPFAGGKKCSLADAVKLSDKMPAIEVYDRARYFAVTGLRLRGQPAEPIDCQEALEWLAAKYWPTTTPAAPVIDWRSDAAVIERARKYIARMPPAIAGQSGHNATFHVACVLVQGFALDEAAALAVLTEYNQTCQPPWSERELRHKVSQAAKAGGERGYLRNSAPERWAQIQVPSYTEPVPEARCTTIVDAAREYLDTLRNGAEPLLTMGLPDLDYALGGGVERGELVILGARPSHGKSAVGLQCCHAWAELGISSLIVSEEMSSRMLGRRTLQFISATPQEFWPHSIGQLEADIAEYERYHKRIVIAEGCGRVDVAAKVIEKHVKENAVQCVVVDYAQLLGATGKSRYEQITNVSITMRQIASSLKVVLLMLCQLSRGIESRNGTFLPVMSDLKESGQLEQDADVIIFACWPWRLNQDEPFNKYQFFVSKNRNRSINQGNVVCQFRPDRQHFLDAPVNSPWEGATRAAKERGE